MPTHKRWPWLLLFVMLAAVMLFSATGAGRRPVEAQISQTPPQIAGCDVFPADNIWNTPVDDLPVHPNSDTYVETIGADEGVHPDFGAGLWEGGPIGIPYTDVAGDQAKVEITFDEDDESDPGPYPIPTDAPIEGGTESDGDRHAPVVDRGNCRLYELFYAVPQEDGSWLASSGAVFDLNSHVLRPDGWTSADAAGLPILPGLVRYDEVAAGEIRHALRFTAPATRRHYVWPARHYASDLTEAHYPSLGLRFRLKADFDISGYSPENQVILRALKRYGMMLADNGSPWYISGAPDDRWDNDGLRELKDVRGSDFEVVDVSSLMVDADSGQVRAEQPPLYVPVARKGRPGPQATITATASATATASPTATPTPTASATPSTTPGTPVVADLFVDDDNTTGTEEGSAQYPYNTVQEAIDAASNGDVIAVASGTYTENVRIENVTLHLYGGYVGGTAAEYAGGDGGDFSQRQSGPPSHLLGDGTDSTVTLLEAGDSTVDGFRITGGTRSVVEMEFADRGGGFYVSGGAPTIAHNLIEDNDTRTAAAPEQEYFGGGIYADSADLSILDNVIRNNVSGRGAGIAVSSGRVVIRDNDIVDNIGVSDHGGGLYIFSEDAQIIGNYIAGNEIGRELGYGWGGGVIIFNPGAFARLSYNTITGNYTPGPGAVFVDDGAHAELSHELIYANECTGSVISGLYVDGSGGGGPGSSLSVSHSTIAGHDCEGSPGGGGLQVETDSVVTVTNTIFWDNGDDEIWVDGTSSLEATYTLAGEALAGPGNLVADPLFADAAGYDYHLRSTAGRWDPAANGGSGDWVLDTVQSPAIDAGDPASAFAAEPAPNGGRANLGVYGNTAEASKSAPDC